VDIDDPNDPRPFAADFGGRKRRQNAPKRKDLPPRSISGRNRAESRAESRRIDHEQFEELWPFGPVEDATASLVVRVEVETAKRRPTELQVQLDPETGKAVWIGIRSLDGLRPTDLQRFPWVTLLAMADATDRAEQETATAEDFQRLGKVAMAAWENRRPPKPPKISRRPGRAGHPDEHYRAVAERYKQLRAAGVSSPTATIANERHWSRATVAGWVRGARDRGYLPPARPGRAG